MVARTTLITSASSVEMDAGDDCASGACPVR